MNETKVTIPKTTLTAMLASIKEAKEPSVKFNGNLEDMYKRARIRQNVLLNSIIEDIESILNVG